ncbi:unnamed protein product [Boreogadus saida]
MGTDCTQSIPAGSRGYFDYLQEELRRRYGGWESPELGQMFQQYGEFAFLEFGDRSSAVLGDTESPG